MSAIRKHFGELEAAQHRALRGEAAACSAQCMRFMMSRCGRTLAATFL